MERILRRAETQERLLICISELEGADTIGVDTETFQRPKKQGTFKEGEAKLETVLSLIQLAFEKDDKFIVWVIDCLKPLDITVLKPYLENKEILKIAHNASYDVGQLRDNGIPMKNVWCTMTAERHSGVKRGLKLANLAEHHLGVKMDKTLQQSKWGDRPLKPEQLRYAALDAQILLQVYQKQIEKGFTDGLYDNTKSAKAALAREESGEQQLLALLNTEQRQKLEWLKQFIFSGNARGFQPTTFVLGNQFLVHYVEDMCHDLLEWLEQPSANHVSDDCSLDFTAWDILELLYEYCNQDGVEKTVVENCIECKSTLYDRISIEKRTCYGCRLEK